MNKKRDRDSRQTLRIGMVFLHLLQKQLFQSDGLHFNGLRGKQRSKRGNLVDVPARENAYSSSLDDDPLDTVRSERFRRRRIIEYEIDPPKLFPEMVQRAFENDSPFLDGDDVIGDLLTSAT
jgi:hypothetical protein